MYSALTDAQRQLLLKQYKGAVLAGTRSGLTAGCTSNQLLFALTADDEWWLADPQRMKLLAGLRGVATSTTSSSTASSMLTTSKPASGTTTLTRQVQTASLRTHVLRSLSSMLLPLRYYWGILGRFLFRSRTGRACHLLGDMHPPSDTGRSTNGMSCTDSTTLSNAYTRLYGPKKKLIPANGADSAPPETIV